MFREAKIGDKAYDVLKGWGTITNIDKQDSYPIGFVTDEDKEYFTYTYEGKINKKHKNPILFWNEMKIKGTEKPFNLKEWLIKNFKKKKFVKSEENYFLYCDYGRDEFEVDEWRIDYSRYYEEIGSVYLEKILDIKNNDLEIELNKNKITTKAMSECLKELGWL